MNLIFIVMLLSYDNNNLERIEGYRCDFYFYHYIPTYVSIRFISLTRMNFCSQQDTDTFTSTQTIN